MIEDVKITININDTLVKLDKMIKHVEEGVTVVEFDSDEMINDIIMEAKENCPVDTGALRDSIRGEGSFPNYMIIADASDKVGHQYGIDVEMGNSHMEAQPFLWPAINNTMKYFIAKVREDFKDWVKQGA